MAQPQIGSIAARKARLAMQSDNLRYHLSRRCGEMAEPTRIMVQGIQVGQRVGSLFALASPLRKHNKAGKILTGFLLAFRFFRRG